MGVFMISLKHFLFLKIWMFFWYCIRMENRKYKNQGNDKIFKNCDFLKAENSIFILEKYFIELKDPELKLEKWK